jgi:hypothetical protein
MDCYQAMRERFTPTMVKLIIIAESPPNSGRYFYDPDGSTGELLYRELMDAFGISRGSAKREGLAAFQTQGLLLLDATYEPVNKIKDLRERDAVILRDYPQLVARLAQFRKTPIVLIKVNVCDLLEAKLIADGFMVLNRGTQIPFPYPGRHLSRFRKEFGRVIK